MRLQINSFANIVVGIFALLAFTATTNAADVVAPTGADRALTVKDFMPHKALTKEFNEIWSYQFVFDNGTRAFVNYSLLHVPGLGRKIGCDLSFWNFKGKTYSVGRQYPPERLVANKEKATITIKTDEYLLENKPGQGHHVLYSADKGGKFLLDVTFESAVPGMVPGDGIWTYGDQKFAQYIHIPYGRVTGKIAYNEDTVTVKGYAYMDQTWQTAQATDMAIRTINFSTDDKSPMHAGRITLTTEGQLMGYALFNGPQGLKVAIPTKVKEGGTEYNGKKFPKTTLAFEWKNGVTPLVFPVSKVMQKASLLDKIDGWFAKKAMKIAAGGEVLFYRGRSQNGLSKNIDWAITGIKD